MSIFESSRKMTHKEQIAFDLGYKKGQHDAVKHGELLTLEDLKQMAGQPVWVEVIDHKMFADKEDDFDGWGLVRSSWVRLWDESRADIVHVDYDFEEYGKTWRAYSAPVKHGKWIHTDKHFFKKGEDGCVDEWTFDYDFHNGVYCEICGRSICVHCDPDWENDKCKKGHYICSECGSHEKENRDYCPNCGARMDGE